MINVIVAFPKIEDAKSIRNLLVRRGFQVAAVCTSGAQALTLVDQLSTGVLVSGYRFPDMLYDELYNDLPPAFEMLLLASARYIEAGICSGVVGVTMPMKTQDFINTLEMLIGQLERKRRKKRMTPTRRSGAESQVIAEAKLLLMDRNHMTEEEAHRYIQKTSMDSGTNMVETAQMIFALMRT